MIKFCYIYIYICWHLARIVVPEWVGHSTPDLVALGARGRGVDARVLEDRVVVDKQLLAVDGQIGGVPRNGGRGRVANDGQAARNVQWLENAVDHVADSHAGRVGAVVEQRDGDVATWLIGLRRRAQCGGGEGGAVDGEWRVGGRVERVVEQAHFASRSSESGRASSFKLPSS